MEEKHYVIQWRHYDEGLWNTYPPKYSSLEEAKAVAQKKGYRLGDRYRIAESYTVTRYKAIKA